MSGPSVICYPALFNAVSIPPGDLQLKGNSIASYIQNAAAAANLSVTIAPDLMNLLPDEVSSNGVNPDMLLGGLTKLLAAAPKTGAVPVGLLLTDTFQEPADSQYGLMFDSTGSDGAYGARQGCVVCLSTIHQAMPGPATDDDFHQFVALIALHELGHAFNLWHAGPGDDSVMQPHSDPTPGNWGTCDFNPLHKNYLARAADPSVGPDVMPGGTPFGTRPSDCGCPSGDDSPFAGPATPHAELRLRIKMSHESFWPFEPIEMDLNLSAVGDGRKSLVIPNEIDPAHESFQIWLTNPAGERRLFRSDIRYCQPNGDMTLTAGKPFRRDISLLRELGRDTFAIPGSYEIQAILRMHKKRLVRSNVVKCKVKPARHGSSRWEKAHEALANHAIRRLFRFKRTPPPDDHVKALVSVARRASPETASMIHYSLGKAFSWSVRRLIEGRSESKLRDRALLHLEHALKHENLGTHRRTTTLQLISNIEDS